MTSDCKPQVHFNVKGYTSTSNYGHELKVVVINDLINSSELLVPLCGNVCNMHWSVVPLQDSASS